jgi:hypothetical protein
LAELFLCNVEEDSGVVKRFISNLKVVKLNSFSFNDSTAHSVGRMIKLDPYVDSFEKAIWNNDINRFWISHSVVESSRLYAHSYTSHSSAKN